MCDEQDAKIIAVVAALFFAAICYGCIMASIDLWGWVAWAVFMPFGVISGLLSLFCASMMFMYSDDIIYENRRIPYDVKD